MTSDQLKAAYEAAQKLSLKDQDMLAKHILERIEEMEWDEKWDEAFAQPVEEGSSMWNLEQEVKANRDAGNLIAYVPGKSLSELFGIDSSEILAS
ncbi:MAG TPA: hypothetical protein VGL94_21170 [Ktedonobacteraceae bacterium]|jgi:hypothetical protein